jgi:two-component system KDP operon response regulator KdpE
MNIQPLVLIIDDEPQILRALRAILSVQFRVASAASGEEGLTLAAASPPDVVILDLGLPDMDGIDVCAHLRQGSHVPIIVLSARDAESDKVAALDQGADDYLTKPFGIEELLARIRVALRHSVQAQGSQEVVVTAGPLAIDLIRHVVTREGTEVGLTATEFKLLAYLAANAGRVLTHQNILTHVWSAQEAENVEYLRVYMRNLRRKLEEDGQHPRFLITAPGVGYRLMADGQRLATT